MTTKNIKTATDVIAEFLDSQCKDESLDAGTVAAVSTLRKDDDLSKVKLLRKLEEARKAALKPDAVNAVEAGND
ncbi:hypothetical protein [Roseovarius nubinhibens]|uniref:Uncharacterized protein n=1 Tax=Roseovarius nubinhibens (strain ATCC BAA-591 / DSM 15170 / ISM) TaxID=89187 RepID=A3SLB3_ROSNI|nr:hypothetical protein [Roseovarius nubinhibens]EAP78144.1 hypothetical protein ISM_07605 [Roseovarius nubinhibens ISM]